MKTIYASSLQLLRQMKQDLMLTVIAFVPFLTGAAFRIIIPVTERLLTDYIGVGAFIAPYYKLIDLFLIIITPSMFNYVVAMVILEEADDHMAVCLAVTPLGKTGYLLSRLGVAGLVSFPVSILIAAIFRLSDMDIPTIACVALAGTVQGVAAALLIVAMSTNKVEGMAVGKMATLVNVGAFAPYFISGKAQYFLSFLPSFWMAKAIQPGNYFMLIISVLLAVLWMVLLSVKFMRKITG